MPEPTPELRRPGPPFRDADEADVFRELKQPGSGATLRRNAAEAAMRRAARGQ